eukprot:SAG31_NODE_23646_length_499_cov_1.422500_1_plen_125_part_01
MQIWLRPQALTQRGRWQLKRVMLEWHRLARRGNWRATRVKALASDYTAQPGLLEAIERALSQVKPTTPELANFQAVDQKIVARNINGDDSKITAVESRLQCPSVDEAQATAKPLSLKKRLEAKVD